MELLFIVLIWYLNVLEAICVSGGSTTVLLWSQRSNLNYEFHVSMPLCHSCPSVSFVFRNLYFYSIDDGINFDC